MKTLKTHFGLLFFLFALGLNAQYVVDFEGTGETKTGYASGTVTLSGIDWNMTEALIGTSATDWKNGARSLRMRGYGASAMTMIQDKTNGAGTVSFQYRRYGTDAQVDWRVEISSDGGGTWTQIGSDFTAPSNNNVQTFSHNANVGGNVRIRIVRATTTGTANRRLNIDDITITDFSPSGPSVDAPQSFTASLATASSISFSATANSNSDNVLLATYSGAAFGPPADGTSYSVGSPLPNGGTVLYVGSASGISNHTGLNAEEEYFYRLWSVDNNNDYSASSLFSSITTPAGNRAIPYSFDFSASPFTNGWIDENVVGTSNWVHGSGEVSFSAFSGSCQLNDNWLISPPFDLNAQADELLSFTTSENFTGTDLQVLYSTNYNGFGDPTAATWTSITTITTGNAGAVNNNTTLQSVSGSQVYIAFRYEFTTGGCSRWGVEDFSITTAVAPFVNLSGTPLNAFTATVGSASASQSFEIDGDNLTGNLNVAAPAGFEVSLTASSGYSNSITINVAGSTLSATDVFVRMTGASVGTFNGDVEVSGGGLTSNVQVAVQGSVTAPVTPDPQSILNATGLASAYEMSFANFVSDTTLPNGWAVDASGSATNKLDFSPWFDGGNTSTGVKYSTAQANVLGYQHTGTTGIATFILTLENQTGFTIEELEVSYLGKVSRTGQGRSPAFEVAVGGNVVPNLAYSTLGDTNGTVQTRVTGLSIPNNQSVEIVWSSDRDNAGSVSSKQIGISNVQVYVPDPGVFPPAFLDLTLLARDEIGVQATSNSSNNDILVVTNNTLSFGEPDSGSVY